MTLEELQIEAGKNSEAKGFHDLEVSVGDRLMLMVTELAEAMEEWRAGHPEYETYYSDGGKPEGVPAELADVVIRIADFCYFYSIDLQKAIDEKMTYNATRPPLHGGKRL